MFKCVLGWVAFVSAAGQARIILNSGNTVSTIAGDGRDAHTVSGHAAGTSLGHPRGLVYDSAGNLYIADSRNHQISRMTPDGTLTIVAGTGMEGFSGDGGPATSALLSQPFSLTLRADGTLLIADTGNHRIRSVSATGVITTLAGTGVPGNSGDGGQASAATLRRPSGITIESNGNVLIADTGNHRIRRINPSGVITAVAGTGEEGDSGDGGPATSATFRAPSALLALADGSILIADTAAHRIRMLHADSTVTAYAAGAPLRRPEGLATGPSGDLLLSDSALQQLLQASTLVTGAVAGSGAQGTLTPGPAQASALDSPSAAATAPDGSVAIADRRNHQVQRFVMPVLDFANIPAGQQSAPQSLTLLNGGMSPVQVTSVSLPSGFIADAGGSCTTVPISLQTGQACTITLVFKPLAQGFTSGIAVVTTDTAPAASLRLTGTAVSPASPAPSLTTLASNGTITYAGTQVQFTATVTGNLSTVPAGNVTLNDGTTTLTTLALAASKATYSTAALTSGTHSLRAVYSGDAHYAASSSSPVAVTVVLPPDFVMSAAAASYSGNASATITVPLTCTPLNGTLNHAVTFSVSSLPVGFVATFAPPVVTLAANPLLSTLTITVPATVAARASPSPVWLAGVLLMLPLAARRSRRGAMLATVALTVTLSGCGGGFRTVSTTGSSTTHRYNITVTATTTGVLGDTLIHSIPVELVITP